MESLHPIRLKSSLHETIWGGRRLERDGWKQLPPGNVAIGESWETEETTIAENEPYRGRTLGSLVQEFGSTLLGTRVIDRFGCRFPLLAKFLDANAKLSVQVHPNDTYARLHEGGKLGKTEFWYVLDAEPGASIIHGFQKATSRAEVHQAILDLTLHNLLQEVPVAKGDIIFVQAGTVHAIGKGVLVFELQEYSDLTYRLYDYGRITNLGTPRELHIERSLDVSCYDRSSHIKMQALPLQNNEGLEYRCLAACQYFVTCELTFHESFITNDYMKSEIQDSCVILTSLGAIVNVRYGKTLDCAEKLEKGQTMVLPANLGSFCIEGSGSLLYSYVPGLGDKIWHAWETRNEM